MPGRPHLTQAVTPQRRRPELRLAGAVAAVGLLAACSTGSSSTEPVAVTPATPSGSQVDACHTLVAALPQTVAAQSRRRVTPDDGTTAAWGDPPIVLRCGVDKPKGFNRFAVCTTVNGVDWYLPETWPSSGDLVLTTVGRNVYVEVSLPVEYLPPAATMANLARAVRSTTTVVKACG